MENLLSLALGSVSAMLIRLFYVYVLRRQKHKQNKPYIEKLFEIDDPQKIDSIGNAIEKMNKGNFFNDLFKKP